MEYTVRKVKGKWGVFTPTGICFDAFISEAKANHIARMHNEAIAPLQTELETLRTRVQELEAENARMLEILTMTANDSLDAQKAALEFITYDGTQEAPQADNLVTLKTEELDWFARHWQGACRAFVEKSWKNPAFPMIMERDKNVTWLRGEIAYQLSETYDTEANRHAIAQRRKQLGLD